MAEDVKCQVVKSMRDSGNVGCLVSKKEKRNPAAFL